MTIIAAPTAFYEGTYDEAIRLLRDTRALLSHSPPDDHQDPRRRLYVNAEYSRIASRLAHVVSWLMAQKAVQSGEVTWRALLDNQPALSNLEICVHDATSSDNSLPDQLRELLASSHALFSRIARLDDIARQQLA